MLRLVRHGATEWTQARRYTGHADIGLTGEGEAQARALVSVTAGFDAAWSSDLRRALSTARLAGVVPCATTALREFDFGDLEGFTWDELDAATRSGLALFDGFVAPGGETVDGFTQRVDEFVDALPAGRHLVFTHGGVVRHLARRAGRDESIPPGSWIDLAI